MPDDMSQRLTGVAAAAAVVRCHGVCCTAAAVVAVHRERRVHRCVSCVSLLCVTVRRVSWHRCCSCVCVCVCMYVCACVYVLTTLQASLLMSVAACCCSAIVFHATECIRIVIKEDTPRQLPSLVTTAYTSSINSITDGTHCPLLCVPRRRHQRARVWRLPARRSTGYHTATAPPHLKVLLLVDRTGKQQNLDVVRAVVLAVRYHNHVLYNTSCASDASPHLRLDAAPSP